MQDAKFGKGLKAGFLILEGRDAGRVVPVSHVPFYIGRKLENDFVLADEQVSRKHIRIDNSREGLILTDMGSRNGVHVDDRRVQKHVLHSGDRVRVGATVLVFHADAVQAREIMAESIPDSHAFAMAEEALQEPEVESKAFLEPTQIRHLDDFDMPEALKTTRALTQASKLFANVLAPHQAASQLLDTFFQGWTPDRAQILWKGDRDIRVARSRQEGKKCAAFDLPGEFASRALAGPVSTKTVVTSEDGHSSEERICLLAPLGLAEGEGGWIYGDRNVMQGSYGVREIEDFDTFMVIAGGVMERTSILKENRTLRERLLVMEKHLSPDVARMLSEQGISIDESALHVEQREVSILFADIEGFTPLSERLSAEELADLLNEYFQRMVDVIIANCGSANKFIGDAVMAIFGAPERHEKDAVNAVSAGLSMIEALERFWEEIDECKRFRIRVGVNTGNVVVGNIGSEKKMEYTALGDAVNVASRLESLSPPNTVTIGSRTAELVGDSFDLDALPSVKVKGKSREINVFRVLGRAKAHS